MTFRALNWSPNEILGETKTDQLADNAEWLFNYTPRALYTLPGGIRRSNGVKIAAGRAVIAQRLKSDSATITVGFNDFFSANCNPIITTGIVAEHQTRIFCVINGIGTVHPDHRGFNISVNIAAEAKKNDKISRSFYISWQAMGY